MGRSGFQAESSSARVPGITDPIVSTVMSITVSTFARVIAARCPRVGQLPLSTERNFMARRCMTRAATKLRVAASNTPRFEQVFCRETTSQTSRRLMLSIVLILKFLETGHIVGQHRTIALRQAVVV